MKVARQNLPKLIAAIVLTVAAVILTGRWILSPGASPESVISIAAGGTGNGSSDSGVKKNPAYSKPFDPTLHYSLLELSEGTNYRGTGRNILSPLIEGHGEKVPLKTMAGVDQPTRPPASLRRMKFFGFANRPNSPKRVFLSQGDDVFVGSEGHIVNRRYKILRIGPKSVDVEDLLENSEHTLALQEG